jgi:hypothetical protein
MAVRKERNRVLRELAAAKNRAFRESMVGKTLSAVTLHEPGMALTENYLKVELAQEREPNRIVDVRDRRRGEWRVERGYISRRPSMAFEMVTSSANSRSLPTGTPMAMRVTLTPRGFNRRARYTAVASPSTVGLVATITS